MQRNLRMAIIIPLWLACQGHTSLHAPINPATIGDIALPSGFSRLPAGKSSFAAWLRTIALKKNNTVFLYNGLPKSNQNAQYAVLDISVGNKDLQQCADAVMRLRAEYFYASNQFSNIQFFDNNHQSYRLGKQTDRRHFDLYLENVFIHCGTLSLQKQLVAVRPIGDMQIGDVLIKGGSPGHAMQVVDMAINKFGKKIYLLAQSYMPAQDLHVVKNPGNDPGDPWYELNNDEIKTPEWIFLPNQLRRWKD